MLTGDRGAQYQTHKSVNDSKTVVDKVANQVATSLQLQEALVSDTKDAHDAQGLILSNLESQIQSNSQVIATVPDQLDQIRKHLQE
jgi:hypothetical protein